MTEIKADGIFDDFLFHDLNRELKEIKDPDWEIVEDGVGFVLKCTTDDSFKIFIPTKENARDILKFALGLYRSGFIYGYNSACSCLSDKIGDEKLGWDGKVFVKELDESNNLDRLLNKIRSGEIKVDKIGNSDKFKNLIIDKDKKNDDEIQEIDLTGRVKAFSDDSIVEENDCE